VPVLGLPRTDWPRLTAAALLLNAALPPFHLLLPSLVCLVPVVLLLDEDAPQGPRLRVQFVRGFWFGVMANAVLFHWVAVALWKVRPWVWLAYGPAILLLGVYTGALFAFVSWVRRSTGLPLLLVFPAAWTALEWLLARHGLVELSWLGLGTSLTGYPVLVQLGDTVGARGLTYLLATANVALALAWKYRAERRRRTVLLSGVVLGLVVATLYGVWRMRTIPLREAGRVTVVQPNLEARRKWTPGAGAGIFAATLALSDSGARATAPHLIVWPEVALPTILAYRADWERRLAEHAWRTGSSLLIGALDMQAAPDGSVRTYNAAFMFDPVPRSDRQPPYYKHSLVLLFERFNGIAAGRQTGLYETAIGRAGVMICYETAFERFARSHARAGATFLLDMSNDAWFSATTGPSQHFAHLVMRAVETRRGVARSANTGPSGFVDPVGRPYSKTRQNEATFMGAPLVTSDVVPLYVRLGDWVGVLSLILVVWFGAVALRRSGRRERVLRRLSRIPGGLRRSVR
jgi:apolipoprotein N-acyltransferase